ncbi:TraR/DksA family transcriptional regulator [Actinomycetota bacterium]
MQEMRDTLAAKAAELQAEIAELESHKGESGGISFGKRIGEGTNIAVERMSQVTTHDNLTRMLEEVRRAEAKIDEGTYGQCDTCHEPIPEGRLEARPWSTRCVAHS